MMSFRVAASCLALVLVAPSVSAEARGRAQVGRAYSPSPVVHDHRSNVRDHRAGASGGGVVVTKTPGGKRRPACVNNVCRDVTR